MNPLTPILRLTAALCALPAVLAAQDAPKTAAQPLWKSALVTPQTPGHAAAVDVALDPAQEFLYLVAKEGTDGYGADWAVWVEPTVSGDFGEKKLTELKWEDAQASWGKPLVNRNPGGEAISVDGKPQANGIGAHANSLLVYRLPKGAERFTAKAALDDGGAKQNGGSIEFSVWQAKPKFTLSGAGGGGGGGGEGRRGGGSGGKSPEEELAGLTTAPGLETTVWAAEPLLLSPAAIDIDARGRVWVAEIVNYRGHKGKRPEGDRIVILEDADYDGRAEKQTVFYQGTDIDSPHGVCVLGNKAIVSANGCIRVLTDTNGDDKADQNEVLFSGISGAQHDHGVHKVMFGPDGRYYFNLGNDGRQMKDREGKSITDLDGKIVGQHRQPYQEGMAFRCLPDGSAVETLGWCFRNNWMLAADSFGTVWQSDNDDDGNKGVRINYVMEGGNFGYKDELTGAGWQEYRTNMEAEIPSRHWHLNDPGVVPNLLLTGAGSPTGIMIYEGTLLPEVFRGQIIHCDAGPNVVRAYPVKKQGAGYAAETVNLLEGTGDKWFRPSDVVAAPDGSLIVADWYDPGVGGHGMGDLDRGRLFRIAPPGHKANVTKSDVTTAAGAVAALCSPNLSARHLGWTALAEMGAKAEPELAKLFADANPRPRARALWLLGRLDAAKWVDKALADRDEDLRLTGLRLAKQMKLDVVPLAARLANDPSAQVRREAALSLRHRPHSDVPKVWAKLAAQHDGQDRWYLEALGIGADGQWDACLAEYLTLTGGADKALATAAGRDVVWRSRAKATSDLLARIVADKAVPDADKMRYLRAFDFQPAGEKQAALKRILAAW